MISVASRLSDLDRYRDRVERYAKARESRTREKNRVAIFSAITNGYDSLKLPERLDPDFDYVLFTDSPAPDTGYGRSVHSCPFIRTGPARLAS